MKSSVRNKRLTARQLEAAPELAALAALHAAAEVAVNVLVAVFPGLTDDERPYWIDQPPAQRTAEGIAVLAQRLQNAIAEHRRTACPSVSRPKPMVRRTNPADAVRDLFASMSQPAKPSRHSQNQLEVRPKYRC